MVQAELYSVTDLAYVGGASSNTAFGINDAGQVVGSYFTPVANGFQEHAFLYNNGTVTNLGTLGGTTA
jgi:probable HAF family extracellular repeat protein